MFGVCSPSLFLKTGGRPPGVSDLKPEAEFLSVFRSACGNLWGSVEGKEGRALRDRPLPLHGRGVPPCRAVWNGFRLFWPQFGLLEVETDALRVEKRSFPYPLSKDAKELADLSSF